MDKSDLEDLLVKLKLETVSVDDAIDELRSLNFKRDRRSPSLPAIFRNCVLAKDKSVEYLSSIIASYLSSKSDFLLLGVDEKKANELQYGNDNLIYSPRASVLYHIKNVNKKSKRKIIVVSSLYADERLVNEVILLGDIFGFDVTHLPEVTVSNIRTFGEYNSPKIQGVVVITGSDYALESLIAEDATQPIISIRDNSSQVDNISAKMSGVINVDSRYACSVFPILYRVTDKK